MPGLAQFKKREYLILLNLSWGVEYTLKALKKGSGVIAPESLAAPKYCLSPRQTFKSLIRTCFKIDLSLSQSD